MDSLHKAPKQKGKKCKNGLLALHINKIYKRLFFILYSFTGPTQAKSSLASFAAVTLTTLNH